MHNPVLAASALEESKADVEALLARHAVIVVIGTGGKGTGAGTIFRLAQMAREQKKLVIPVFVRPSFERHEVEKRRYDHALGIADQFDQAGIRLVENPQRPWLHGHESRAAIRRVRADESSDCERAARVALRLVGSLAGRSVRPLRAVWRRRQVAHRLCGAESRARPRTRRRRHRGGGPRVLGQPLLRVQRTGRHVPRLHPRGLVERGRRQDQGRARGARAPRLGRQPVQPALRESASRPAAVGCDCPVRRVHRASPGARHRLDRGAAHARRDRASVVGAGARGRQCRSPQA